MIMPNCLLVLTTNLHEIMIVILTIISLYLAIVIYCTSSGSHSVNQPLNDDLNLELRLAPPTPSSQYMTQNAHNLQDVSNHQDAHDHSSENQIIGSKREHIDVIAVNQRLSQPKYKFRAKTKSEQIERRRFRERERYKVKMQRVKEEGKEALDEFRQTKKVHRKASLRRVYNDPVKLEKYREKRRNYGKSWYKDLKKDPEAYKRYRGKANLSTQKYYHSLKDKDK